MNLESLGLRTDHLAALDAIAAERAETLIPGRVVRQDRGRWLLSIPGADEEPAVVSHRAGLPSLPVVGDWVAASESTPRLIRAVLSRSGVLCRGAAGGGHEPQPLAANVDLVLIVQALDRAVKPGFLERASALAWDAGAQPIALLTKPDLVGDPEALAASVASSLPGLEVLLASGVRGDGLAELRERLSRGLTAVLLGPSGAGKSTLANALVGEERALTGAVRAGDHKGRHTTTHRELIALPSGGALIDSPGVRELALWCDPEAASAAFEDLDALAHQCRFSDCAHQGEPGCAVLEAIAGDALAQERLERWRRLQRELEHAQRRTDPLVDEEHRRRERQLTLAGWEQSRAKRRR